MKKSQFFLTFFVFLVSAFFACKKEEILLSSELPSTKDPVKSTEVTIQYLGEMLFYDPILSGNKDVACATCHHPNFSFSDGRDLAIGVNGVGLGPQRRFQSDVFSLINRRSMTILNTVFNGMDSKGNYDSTNAPMFWDSRVKSLEEQALLPIKSELEMRGNAYPEAVAIDSVLNRLKNISEYRVLFSKIFNGDQPITSLNLARAIASFERTLVAMNSPYDRYLRGDKEAMSELEIRGMNAFEVDGCNKCHSGKMFSDYKLHTLSVPDNPRLDNTDKGANGSYGFRTTSLRNIKQTGPYMHNGVFKTLEEVIEFYNLIEKEKSQNPNVPVAKIDSLVKFLRPVNEKAAIVAFLGALTSDYDFPPPKRVPSNLSVGGNIKLGINIPNSVHKFFDFRKFLFEIYN
ncbi:MAG TPA: cytochrome-c peroxidase [Leadbetterella sp.]|nr:cytochrome-c peroxidase [Leadbetterella sp.]